MCNHVHNCTYVMYTCALFNHFFLADRRWLWAAAIVGNTLADRRILQGLVQGRWPHRAQLRQPCEVLGTVDQHVSCARFGVVPCEHRRHIQHGVEQIWVSKIGCVTTYISMYPLGFPIFIWPTVTLRVIPQALQVLEAIPWFGGSNRFKTIMGRDGDHPQKWAWMIQQHMHYFKITAIRIIYHGIWYLIELPILITIHICSVCFRWHCFIAVEKSSNQWLADA